MIKPLKIVFSISFVLFTVSGFSQEIKLLLGDSINQNLGDFDFITTDNSAIYVLRTNKNSNTPYHLEKYDKGTLRKTGNINIPFFLNDSVKFTIQKLLVHNGYYQLFYSYYDQNSGLEKLELIKFNENGSIEIENKLLEYSQGINDRKAGEFHVKELPLDSGFVVSFYRHTNDTNFIRRSYYDFSFKKIKEDKFNLEKEFGKPLTYYFDSNGNFYNLTSSTPKRKGSLIRMRIITSSDSVINLEFLKPSKYDVYISPYISFLHSENGLLNFISSYSETAESYYPFGFYWIQIDSKNFTCVNERFVKFKRAKVLSKDEDDFNSNSCIITNIDLKDNGGYVIQFEKMSAVNYTMFYAISVVKDYEFGNICQLSVDSYLKEEYLVVTKKNQHLNGDYNRYGGHFYLRSDQGYYFLYNDLPENLIVEEKVKKLNSDRLHKAQIYYTHISDSTILKKNSVSDISNKNYKGWLFTSNNFRLNNKECISVLNYRLTSVSRLAKFYLEK